MKVVRSPDGESRGFPIGAMSVQRAAATVLDQYYTSFPIYNPFLDRMNGGTPIAGSAGASGMQGGVRQRGPGSQVGKTGIKVYDVDGPNVSCKTSMKGGEVMQNTTLQSMMNAKLSKQRF